MRRSGILLPISSLPSRFGVGELGQAARDFADLLSDSGQSVWQVLPLNIPDFVHSPYASPSAFAGNPLLIDPADLAKDGLLTKEEIDSAAAQGRTDYSRAASVKEALFRRAYRRFSENGTDEMREAFDSFSESARPWLSDFALFDALRASFGGAPIWEWEEGVRTRKKAALARASSELSEEIRYRKFLQFLFQRQLFALRAYLAERGISFLGDIPFYVSADSADVWTHPELFSDRDVAGL